MGRVKGERCILLLADETTHQSPRRFFALYRSRLYRVTFYDCKVRLARRFPLKTGFVDRYHTKNLLQA